MADTSTDILGLLLMETGNDNNTWGGLLNTQVIQYIEDKFTGRTAISTTGGTTVATQAQLRAAFLVISGTLVSNAIIQVLNKKNSWYVVNNCTGAFTLTFKTSGGSASAAIPQGGHALVFCDGSDVCTVGIASNAITGQIPGADGTAAAPTYSYTNDLDCGWYRIGANNLGFALNGAKVADWSTTGLSVTGTITASLGMTVTAGGLTITAGGLTVTAGAVSLPTGAIASAALAADSVVTAKILDANVTYAKIQNLTTARLLGRYTAGSGVCQELSLGTELTLNTGTGAISLTDPIPVIKVSTQTASVSAALTFTGIDSTYRVFEFTIENLVPATASAQLIVEVSDDGGSSWKTSGYLSALFATSSAAASASLSATASLILTQFDCSNTSNLGICGFLELIQPGLAANTKQVNHRTCYRTASGGLIAAFGGGSYTISAAAINAIRFRFSTGNITSGVIVMRGRK